MYTTFSLSLHFLNQSTLSSTDVQSLHQSPQWQANGTADLAAWNVPLSLSECRRHQTRRVWESDLNLNEDDSVICAFTTRTHTWARVAEINVHVISHPFFMFKLHVYSPQRANYLFFFVKAFLSCYQTVLWLWSLSLSLFVCVCSLSVFSVSVSVSIALSVNSIYLSIYLYL